MTKTSSAMSILLRCIRSNMSLMPGLFQQAALGFLPSESLSICHTLSLRMVNIIREYEEIFPAWHTSDTAKLYSPAIFVNKKKAGGYWF